MAEAGVDDSEYMRQAMTLAERGRRRAHPNPLVGAVVVARGEIVGSGYHSGPGTPHAEAAALEAAGPRARRATLYSSLEPCCHQGRTPPCTEAIIVAGIARVVTALRDPNPVVDGRGLTELRDAGVDVAVLEGEPARAAREQNRAYLKAVRAGLPYITYKVASSLDGKVAGAQGEARWLSGKASRRVVHEMRAHADAVMVGLGTVRRDDPQLTVRDVEGEDPVRVVVSRGGDVPLKASVVQTAGQTPTLVVTERIGPEREAALGERGVEVIVTGEGGLRAGLAALAQRGLLDILCEGGPTLAGSLLQEDLIDEVAVFVTPLIIGRGALDVVGAAAAATPGEAWHVHDVTWTAVGDDLLLRGRLHADEA